MFTRCRPVVFVEPSVRWPVLVLGMCRIGENHLLGRRQAIHEGYIVRNKSLLLRRVSLLREPLRPFPVEAEIVHQIAPGREYSTSKVSRSHACTPFVSQGGYARKCILAPPTTRPSYVPHAKDTLPNPTTSFPSAQSHSASGAPCKGRDGRFQRPNWASDHRPELSERKSGTPLALLPCASG